MFLLLLLFFTFVASSWAQQSKTIASANQSIDNAVPDYRIISNRLWFGPAGVGEFLNLVYSLQNNAALNISILYSNNTEAVAVFNSISNPQTQACIAAPFNYSNGQELAQLFFSNETALEQYLCCQLSIFNTPGLSAFMTDVERYFFGLSQSSGWINYQSDVVTAIGNVNQLRTIVSKSIISAACKDDKRIHVNETQTLRAKLTGGILGVITKLYTFAQARASSLQGCLTAPTAMTTCINDVGLTLGFLGLPNYDFLPYDGFFQPVCGQSALASFEAFSQTPITCSPSKRRKE